MLTIEKTKTSHSEIAHRAALRKADVGLRHSPNENDADVALYDGAKSNDDGYRISSGDLRKKYGI